LERKPPAEAREERADARTVLSILAKGRESEREKEREREREREKERERERERERVIAPRLLRVTL